MNSGVSSLSQRYPLAFCVNLYSWSFREDILYLLYFSYNLHFCISPSSCCSIEFNEFLYLCDECYFFSLSLYTRIFFSVYTFYASFHCRAFNWVYIWLYQIPTGIINARRPVTAALRCALLLPLLLLLLPSVLYEEILWSEREKEREIWTWRVRVQCDAQGETTA